MAQIGTPRCSPLHRPSTSTPGYFEFNPSTQSDNAVISTAMYTQNVRRLDAFHARPVYGLPKDAHLYAHRKLPPLPAPVQRNHLRKMSSAKSLHSPVSPLRPSLSPKHRMNTTDCVNRPLPALPLRNYSHSRAPSVDTTVLIKPVVDLEPAPLRRPRQMRSISFRNFLNRNTFPPSASDPSRSASVQSQSSESSNRNSRDSRHDSICEDSGLSHSKASTPTSSAPGSRRPSTLSLASLRSRKISQENVPSVPRPSSARKNSTSTFTSGHRWALFSKSDKTVLNQSAIEDDEENIPAVPITPPANATELSCVRCYYYSMRNCNGWVMGGSHGDACDSCTVRSI